MFVYLLVCVSAGVLGWSFVCVGVCDCLLVSSVCVCLFACVFDSLFACMFVCLFMCGVCVFVSMSFDCVLACVC